MSSERVATLGHRVTIPTIHSQGRMGLQEISEILPQRSKLEETLKSHMDDAREV